LRLERITKPSAVAAKGSISVSLTRRDFEDFAVFAALAGPFARTVVFRRLQLLLLPVAAVLILVLIALALDLPVLGGGVFGHFSPWMRWAIVALAGIVAAAWLGLPYAVRVWVRRGIATPQYDALLQPLELSLSGAGVACDNASGAIVTPWQAVRAVAVVNAAIYVFTAPFQAIIVPRRSFSDAAAFDDFVTEISSYQAQADSDWALTKAVVSPRRVVAASAAGVFAALLLGTASLFYVGTTKAFFIATFDEHLKRAPVEAAIIEADPVLREQVLRATADAFATGGWDAANDELHTLMSAKAQQIEWTYIVLADDQSLLAVWRAYRDVGKALAANPAACRSYLADGGRAPPNTQGLKSAADQKAAAYRSGAANLVKGMAPIFPSDQVARALFDRAMASGPTFSVAEWNVVTHKTAGLPNPPDAVVCAAQIKFFDKILSLPDRDAAQLIRYEWGPAIARLFSASSGLG
jgi:hypothetical protein